MLIGHITQHSTNFIEISHNHIVHHNILPKSINNHINVHIIGSQVINTDASQKFNYYTEMEALQIRSRLLFGKYTEGKQLIINLINMTLTVLYPINEQVLEFQPLSFDSTFTPTDQQQDQLFINGTRTIRQSLQLNHDSTLFISILSTFIGDSIARTLPMGGVHIISDIQIEIPATFFDVYIDSRPYFKEVFNKIPIKVTSHCMSLMQAIHQQYSQ